MENLLSKKLFEYLGDPMEWFGAKKLPPDSILSSLIKDMKAIPCNVDDDFYRLLIISDCYLVTGKLKEAYKFCPLPEIGQQWALLSNRRLNLLHAIGQDITAIEILSLFPKRLTEYGKNNLNDIACIIEEKILSDEAYHGDMLEATLASGTVELIEFPLFNGTLYSKDHDLNFPWYDFTSSSFLRDKIKNISRFAENILREEKGIPAVGEGWIAETELYHLLQKAFPDKVIEHHASPQWLGRQHIDIFFPDDRIGIEYQGLQHKKPVEYFGGTSAFEEQQKRDRRKKMLCTRNRVEILYVEKGYKISSIIKDLNILFMKHRSSKCQI
ncbi:hypothetical protein GF340_01250 [Candidatus Peregrinibacteria bacterium]|nr:hypothetical protein [Candidatus Peregrinibacteria bacterium]